MERRWVFPPWRRPTPDAVETAVGEDTVVDRHESEAANPARAISRERRTTTYTQPVLSRGRVAGRNRTVRYRGYRTEDHAKPYAKYFTPHTDPPQQGVADALAGGPLAPGVDPPFERIADDLRPTGYSPIEFGYGQRPDGVLFVAALTTMPRNTAAMWDWWFGWHSNESARYKLWHPDAHEYAGSKTDTT